MPWWRWEGSGTGGTGSFQGITAGWDGRVPPVHESGQMKRMSRLSKKGKQSSRKSKRHRLIERMPGQEMDKGTGERI